MSATRPARAVPSGNAVNQWTGNFARGADERWACCISSALRAETRNVHTEQGLKSLPTIVRPTGDPDLDLRQRRNDQVDSDKQITWFTALPYRDGNTKSYRLSRP